MLTLLRILLGILNLLALAAFVLVMLVGKGFDAYRSGNVSSARDLLPFAVPIVLGAMFVSVFTPGARVFLHIVAVLVGVVVLQCATIIPEHPGEGALYLSFFGLWLLYYGLAVWGSRP